MPDVRTSRRQPACWHAETEVVVQFYDLDPMDVVWHGHYVRYLEVVRCVLLEQLDYNYTQMKQSGYAWPVVDLQLRYAAPARFGQRLRLRAELVEWENRLKIRYEICDAASGQRLTRATTVQVAVDMTTGEMCFVTPPVLRQKMGVDQ